eukprot:TRINITY_DN49397_c0_g1_i1.p2 TRINITY_DN49397_c0_g1~~TRINITY_DN49397_c0_g1_i1.p2  ORF type:complete len:233 (-),score=49.43 TRINITY_DN49397_c0_g1_i1:103-801(-)
MPAGASCAAAAAEAVSTPAEDASHLAHVLPLQRSGGRSCRGAASTADFAASSEVASSFAAQACGRGHSRGCAFLGLPGGMPMAPGAPPMPGALAKAPGAGALSKAPMAMPPGLPGAPKAPKVAGGPPPPKEVDPEDQAMADAMAAKGKAPHKKKENRLEHAMHALLKAQAKLEKATAATLPEKGGHGLYPPTSRGYEDIMDVDAMPETELGLLGLLNEDPPPLQRPPPIEFA